MTNLERMLELKASGLKNKQIASELGVTKNTVIGALWRHKQAQVVDTQGGVAWSHHNFVQGANGLWTQYGNEMISVETEQAGQAAA
jgi:orotate phosphoribosyltransferase-like protein